MATHIPEGSFEVEYAGSLDISGANTLESEVLSFLCRPFILKRLFFNVTTATTVASSALTVYWRPIAGSAVGQVLLATITFPVAAIDTYHAFDAFVGAGTTTVLDAGGPTDSGGIGGITFYEGETDLVGGPGGSFVVISDGGATAGVVGIWAEVWSLPFAGTPVATVGVLSGTV